jgi:hypothetical protein
MQTKPLQQFLRFLWISAVIAIVVQLINYMGGGYDYNQLIDYKSLIVNFSYAFIIGTFNIIFFTLIGRKFSWSKHPKILTALGIPGSVIVSVLGFLTARLLHSVWIYGNTFEGFLSNLGFWDYLFPVFIALIVTLAFHAYYFYKFGVEAELKVQRELIENTKAQHRALKDQLDPHFLFNSLNVLSALIEEDPKKASEFTNAMSKVYRYVLDQRQEDLVSLESEIEFAKTYLNLLMMRFEDSLHFKISTPDHPYKIIPLSLQLLLENAIKHNKVTEHQPLQIQIYIDDEYLVVENTLNLKPNTSNRKGIGLDNITKRFAVFTDKEILLEENSTHFKVKLPLIQPQNLRTLA